jgi:hypothetical protein
MTKLAPVSVPGLPASETASAAPRPLPRPTRAKWVKATGLALLPVLLVLACYYRPFVLHGASELPVDADAGFAVYQMGRMGELNGQWWKLADDDLVGKPYPSGFAKHPGLYEGVDLLLISSVTSRFLDPVVNYHVLMMVVLVFNGWVAAWMTLRLTRSHGWAALAVVLITFNMSTAIRMSIGHLHLFKYGWVLLVVWAFFRYLDGPSLRRGAWLGLTMALLLQSSFYMAFLLGLCLATYWLAVLLTGRLQRQHLSGAGLALLTLAVVGTALTLPTAMMIVQNSALVGQYTYRDPRDLWIYGSDLAQYFVSPQAPFAGQIAQARPAGFEGYNYPGLLVLLAIAAYLLSRTNGLKVAEPNTQFLNRALVLMAIMVVLSLTGGPSIVIFQWVPMFRSYGRAGLLAVGLWSVATPVILQGMLGLAKGSLLRTAAIAAVLIVSLNDAYQGQRWFKCHATPPPPWVGWLAEQPAEVRLVAFPAIHPYEMVDVDSGHWRDLPYFMLQMEIDKWHWPSVAYRTMHRHATLNGCELALLEADLKLHGASYEKMNEAGLSFIASQGYNTLAFQRAYLEWHPWIEKVPWLERVEALDGWQIYRVCQASRK